MKTITITIESEQHLETLETALHIMAFQLLGLPWNNKEETKEIQTEIKLIEQTLKELRA